MDIANGLVAISLPASIGKLGMPFAAIDGRALDVWYVLYETRWPVQGPQEGTVGVAAAR